MIPCFILLTCIFPSTNKPCYINTNYIKAVYEWELPLGGGKMTSVTVDDVKESPEAVIKKIKECK